MSGFSRFFKKSLVLNPYITVTAVLSAIGVAIPTTYWFVGDTSEHENSFSIVREMYRDPIKDFATNEQGKYLNPEIREQQRLLAVKKHAELRRQHAE